MFSRRQLLLVVLALWSSGLPNCLAGGGPENVFLLVNSASRDSMTVATTLFPYRTTAA